MTTVRVFRGLDEEARREAREAYRKLNDSPMQRRLRAEAPLWVGAVYWNPQEESYEAIRDELKRIRDAGFTFVRFHCIQPRELGPGQYDYRYPDMRLGAAEEVGLKSFPHLQTQAPSPAALAAAGLSAEQAAELGPTDERVAGAILALLAATIGHYRHHPTVLAWGVGGEPHKTPIPLESDLDRRRFLAWLQEHYDSPEQVHRAWLIYPNVGEDLFIQHGRGRLRIATWDDAVDLAARVRQPAGVVLATTDLKHEIFGATRDLVRFRCDQTIAHRRACVELVRQVDPDHPICVGNHQLMYNHAQLGWDVFNTARVADLHFTSIHLSWHFEPAFGEVDRPVYMQSRMTADAFKGGATSAFETTGGTVQYSGGYGHHMDAGLMRRLMLSYLAGGNEVIAFWCWRCRPGGLEAGEYALTTLSGRISEWAVEAGRVIGGMRRHVRELWNASEQPELGILRSWDTEMALTLEPRRFDLQDGPSELSSGPAQQHMRALIGASRAAINQQVAFEYVTDEELLAGAAGAYPTIYLPHVRACSDALLEALLAYVEAGGRLIADVQVGFHDPWGKVRPRGQGTLLERLFGGWVDTIHDARTSPQRAGDVQIDAGFYGDLVLTSAQAVRRFANGKPAVSEAVVGRGQSILVAFDAARACHRPGNDPVERMLGDCYRGPWPRRFFSDAPIVARRSTEAADHWFLLNDGAARSAVLRVYDRTYVEVEDVLTGQVRPVTGTISVDLPACSGVWLRCRRAQGG